MYSSLEALRSLFFISSNCSSYPKRCWKKPPQTICI